MTALVSKDFLLGNAHLRPSPYGSCDRPISNIAAAIRVCLYVDRKQGDLLRLNLKRDPFDIVTLDTALLDQVKNTI